MAERVDFVGKNGVYIGQDVTFRFQIFKRDGTTPDDVSGWTAVTFTVRKSLGDAAEEFSKSISGGGISVVAGDPTNFPEEVSGSNSVFKVVVLDTDTDGLSVGFYAYDVKRMDAGLEVPVTIGTIEALQGVTG